MRHALAISRLRTGGLGIKTMRVLMMFLIEPVMDRLLAGCMEMLFHTCCIAHVHLRDYEQPP